MDIKMDIGNIAKFYGPLPRNTSSRADCIESGLVRLWTFPPPPFLGILPPSRRTCTRRVSVYQPWHKSLGAMARYYHLLP